MTEPELLPPIDPPPSRKVWRDHLDLNPTEAEVEEGNQLGRQIDPDDDRDNGLGTTLPRSETSALADARYLTTFYDEHGVDWSIELQPGRPGPADTWHAAKDFRGLMRHHTVSRPSNGPTPVLALCKSGRVDVPGPLCNTYLGYDLRVRVLCVAWANHPGAGGALTLSGPYGAFTVPKDVARPYLWGQEAEGGLEPWSQRFLDVMARCAAAELRWVWSKRLGYRVGSVADLAQYQTEHKTWAPTRKTDRFGYTTESGRAATRAALTQGPTGGNDVGTLEGTQAQQLQRVWEILAVNNNNDRFLWIEDRLRNLERAAYGGNDPAGEQNNFHWLEGQVRQMIAEATAAGEVDVDELAAAIVKLTPPRPPTAT